MPIYEYECLDCGKVSEQFQMPTEAPIEKCPYCKGRIRKLISNCSFQLKGTGWYVTDYPKKSLTNGDKKEKKSLAKPSGESAKTDSGTKTETPVTSPAAKE